MKDQLPLLAVAILAAAVIFFAVAATQHYLLRVINRRAGINFQVELYQHIQKQSSDFYQRTHVGEITTRLTSDVAQGVVGCGRHLANGQHAHLRHPEPGHGVLHRPVQPGPHIRFFFARPRW